jgi:hypothetical protein
MKPIIYQMCQVMNRVLEKKQMIQEHLITLNREGHLCNKIIPLKSSLFFLNLITITRGVFKVGIT